MHRIGLASLMLGLILWGCGGGSSPSEPGPTPPASLAGTWSGTVTLTNRVVCTIALAVVQDGQDFIGNWEGRCPDAQGTGIAVISPLFADRVFVVGLQGQPVFGGCGWSSLTTQDRNRLRGEFNTPQNCQGGPPLSGQLDLTKR